MQHQKEMDSKYQVQKLHHQAHMDNPKSDNMKENKYFHNHHREHPQSYDNVMDFDEDSSVNVNLDGDGDDQGDEEDQGILEGDKDNNENSSTTTTRTNLSQATTTFHSNFHNNKSLFHTNESDLHPRRRLHDERQFYHHQQYYQNQQEKCLKIFLSELLGTLLFVYLSQAAISSFELIGTQNDTIGRSMGTIFARSLALLVATLLTYNISGAHLNPAYSLSSAIFNYIKYRNAMSRILAQYLGSFFAAILLHLTYFDKLNQRHSEGLLIGKNFTLRSHGNLLSTGKFFSSFPPTEVSHFQLFTSYILANANYALLAATILMQQFPTSQLSTSGQLKASSKSSPSYQLKPIHLALSYGLILASFSANGGPVLNPAQDFSTRLYMSLTSWGSSAFNLYHGHYWWLCGILAPHVGFIIGFGIYKIFSNLNTSDDIYYNNNRRKIQLNENKATRPTNQRNMHQNDPMRR